jgi:hypothetical protein
MKESPSTRASNPRSQPTPGFTVLLLYIGSAYVATSKRFAAQRG